MNSLTVQEERLFSITPAGLNIVGSPTFDEWQQIGHCIVRGRSAMQWALGDWLQYGEQQWGEMYSQAIDMTGYSENTLKSTKWVASRFPTTRRRENLSFSHHKEVAGLPAEQADSILDKAERNELPTTAIRELVRSTKGLPDPEVNVSKPAQIMSQQEYEREAKQEYEASGGESCIEQEGTDQIGNPIPNATVQDAFDRAQDEIVPLKSSLSKIKSILLDMIESEDPLVQHMDHGQLRQYINGLYKQLDLGCPHAVCPFCSGCGCHKCCGMGWMPAYTWKHSVPKSMKGDRDGV